MEESLKDMAKELDQYLAKLVRKSKKDQNILVLPLIEEEILLTL